jgi:hypothetical protein
MELNALSEEEGALQAEAHGHSQQVALANMNFNTQDLIKMTQNTQEDERGRG